VRKTRLAVNRFSLLRFREQRQKLPSLPGSAVGRFLPLGATGLFVLTTISAPGTGRASLAYMRQQPAPRQGVAAKEQPDQLDQQQPNPVKIGIVTAEPDGAGCSLQFPSDYKKQNDRSVFNSGDENSTDDCECAFMNIDGRQIKLRRIYSKWPPGGDNKVGNRGVQIYVGSKTRVQVNYVVSHVCGPRDGEDCEVTWFSATIKVTRRGLSSTLNLRGVCGT